MLRKYLSLGAAALALGLGASKPVSAATTTFAQFFENGGGNDFVFTNTGNSSSGFSLTSSSVPVYFLYQVPNGAGAEVPIAATMSFSALVNGPATSSGGNISQGLQDLRLTFTADSAINGKTNLLTVYDSSPSGVTGSANGPTNTQSPTVTGDNTIGNDVQFSSDFLSFTGATEENYSLAFSSLINQVDSSAGLAIGSDGYLQSFAAAGTGTFASDPAPSPPPSGTPEPGVLSMVAALGASGMFGFMKRRKK